MNYLRLSFLLLALAVVTGAFGAHTLRDYLSEDQLHSWHTAVEYHFYHGLGILLLSVLALTGKVNAKRIATAQLLLFIGVICFCGSIYLLSTQNIFGFSMRWLGPVTPLGGLFFIGGWVWAIAGVSSVKEI